MNVRTSRAFNIVLSLLISKISFFIKVKCFIVVTLANIRYDNNVMYN